MRGPYRSLCGEGVVEVKNYLLTESLQFDLPAVLHSLNFSIKPGEKIGILGRTGMIDPQFVSALQKS